MDNVVQRATCVYDVLDYQHVAPLDVSLQVHEDTDNATGFGGSIGLRNVVVKDVPDQTNLKI